MKQNLVWVAMGAVGIVGIVTIWSYVFARDARVSAPFKHDADIVRLNDLKLIGELIQEYRAEVGTYPLQGGSELQHYVLIGAEAQLNPEVAGPSYRHEAMSTEDFEALLSKALDRPIRLPYDPQLLETGKPNFYIYMMSGDTYYFAVHLNEPYGVAKEVAGFYYKLEISNSPEPDVYWDFDALMVNEDYLEAAGKPMSDPAFLQGLSHRKE